MIRKPLTGIALTLGFLLSSSLTADEAATVVKPVINDYPTQARVEFVIGCMNRYGGENYNQMYGCVCAIDKIAETIPYAGFVATSTLAVMIQTPGEKGGAFRDAPGGRKAIREFHNFIAKSEASCGLKKANKPSN